MANNNLQSTVTMLDILNTEDPSGGLARIYNPTIESNDFVKYLEWMECNNGQTHQGTRVTNIMSSTEKVQGVGVVPSAGAHANYVEDTKTREIWIEIEDSVLDGADNPDAYIQLQASHAVQAIWQDMIQDMLYGSRYNATFGTGNAATSTGWKDINGLYQKIVSFNAGQGAIASGAYTDRKLGRVYRASGASGNYTSVWIAKFGDEGIHGIYPQNAKMGGIQTQSYPLTQKVTSNGGVINVYRIRVRVAFGLVVNNPRYFCRIAQIDANISAATFVTDVENNIISYLNDTPNGGEGFAVLCNPTIKTMFDIRAKEKSNVWYREPEGVFGKRQTMFQDLPILRVDRIVNTEAAIGTL
jgi:hypothetical protein